MTVAFTSIPDEIQLEVLNACNPLDIICCSQVGTEPVLIYQQLLMLYAGLQIPILASPSKSPSCCIE